MPAQLTVLRAITRLNIGGPAIHAILLTRGLQNERFRSILVSGQEAPREGNMLDLARAHGVEPLVVEELGREVNLLDDFAALRRMYRVIRAERPHIVHTHMAKAGTAARLAAWLARVPIVVHTYHGHVFHSYFSPAKTRVFLAIEQALGRVTDQIVAVGEKQRAELASSGVAPAGKIVTIPLGLEIEPMLEAERDRGSFKQELGLDEDERLVGIVARLVPIKAHDVFLEAAAEVSRRVPKARFAIVGDGELRGRLEARAAELGLGDRAMFLGWRRDMRRVLADLDVVTLSSLNEGSPVAIIEAMAAARPVVVTDVGGVAEVVRGGESGLLVPPRNAPALAEGIVRLLQDPAEGERLGAAARCAVYPRYASTRLVQDVERLYRDLAGRKGLAS
ncbi:MAG: glycosyltransferase [Chloroflexi bacterium]|nr:glycosyltransferase [Chloroflexota bacterium]